MDPLEGVGALRLRSGLWIPRGVLVRNTIHSGHPGMDAMQAMQGSYLAENKSAGQGRHLLRHVLSRERQAAATTHFGGGTPEEAALVIWCLK